MRTLELTIVGRQTGDGAHQHPGHGKAVRALGHDQRRATQGKRRDGRTRCVTFIDGPRSCLNDLDLASVSRVLAER